MKMTPTQIACLADVVAAGYGTTFHGSGVVRGKWHKGSTSFDVFHGGSYRPATRDALVRAGMLAFDDGSARYYPTIAAHTALALV